MINPQYKVVRALLFIFCLARNVDQVVFKVWLDKLVYKVMIS